MSKVMSIFTTKHQFDSNTKIHCPNPNWRIVKPNKWRNCIRKNVDENIYKNYRTWAIAVTPIILRHHKSHQLPWIDTMILDRMHRQNHHYSQGPLLVHYIISRVKRQGKCLDIDKHTNWSFNFVQLKQRVELQKGRHHLHKTWNWQKLVWGRT